MEKHSDFNKIEKNLAKAVSDANYWQDVCDDAADLFEDGVGSIFINWVPKGRGPWLVFSETLDPLFNEYIEGGWYKKDYRENGKEFCRSNGYVTDFDIINPDEMEQLPYYRDFLFRFGFGCFIAICIKTINGEWALAIQCKRARKPFSQDEIAKAHKLRALLVEATTLAAKTAKKKFNDFVSLLGETQNDIIILTPEGEILQRYDGRGVYQDNAKAQIGGFFTDLIEDTYKDEVLAVCECTAADNLKMAFTHEVEGESVSTNILQIPNSLRHFYSRAKAIVYTSKTSQPTDNRENLLANHYGLTRSEITVTKFLAEGYSIKDISDVLGLEESTIRQRFKMIYSKTGMTSQAKLVTMIYKIENGSWRSTNT